MQVWIFWHWTFIGSFLFSCLLKF